MHNAMKRCVGFDVNHLISCRNLFIIPNYPVYFHILSVESGVCEALSSKHEGSREDYGGANMHSFIHIITAGARLRCKGDDLVCLCVWLKKRSPGCTVH